jgi:hypothetical protein
MGVGALIGVCSGLAFVGPPELHAVAAGVVAAVVAAWLAAGWWAQLLERGGFGRAACVGVLVSLAAFVAASVVMGLVGFLWPTVSGWHASTPVEAILRAGYWLTFVGAVPALIGGVSFGLLARWACDHREVA